jgi:hypothetical protein
MIHRGPYKHEETAGAVRDEMERSGHRTWNLWIIGEELADVFDDEWEKANAK